ncbi:hypothetical protein MMPV_002551 [Pyropia vietnamensis]
MAPPQRVGRYAGSRGRGGRQADGHRATPVVAPTRGVPAGTPGELATGAVVDSHADPTASGCGCADAAPEGGSASALSARGCCGGNARDAATPPPSSPAALAATDVVVAKSPAETAPTRPAIPVQRAGGVPAAIAEDPDLLVALEALPANYSFEVPKTVWRIRQARATTVALQMPEGLLRYAGIIGDILRAHAGVTDILVLGDVTYGACCVDDMTASCLGAEFLVHYGHSCLVPVTTCSIPAMYVFVHIGFDPSHLMACLVDTFPPTARLALTATIQFVDTLHALGPALREAFPKSPPLTPQAKPLSPGELLGCTAPSLDTASLDALVYVGDGRFHLESAMIANPGLQAYRYDPYAKTWTEEVYDHPRMRAERRKAISAAASASHWGVIQGTLGRQGSPAIIRRLTDALTAAGRSMVVVLLAELSLPKLRRLTAGGGIQAWVQVACPRLSIDWGEGFASLGVPLLTPYEAYVAIGQVAWREVYPMDYYAKGGGRWSNYWVDPKVEAAAARLKAERRAMRKAAQRAIEEVQGVELGDGEGGSKDGERAREDVDRSRRSRQVGDNGAVRPAAAGLTEASAAAAEQ